MGFICQGQGPVRSDRSYTYVHNCHVKMDNPSDKRIEGSICALR